MINKNNKGRGEENNSVVRRPKIGVGRKYGYPTSIDYKKMIRKVAVAGFVVAAMGGWVFP